MQGEVRDVMTRPFYPQQGKQSDDLHPVQEGGGVADFTALSLHGKAVKFDAMLTMLQFLELLLATILKSGLDRDNLEPYMLLCIRQFIRQGKVSYRKHIRYQNFENN